MITQHPDLAARFFLMPRRGLHAIGAYLAVTTAEDEEVAARLHEHPRTLLRETEPGLDPRVYRAMDRAPDVVQTADFYAALFAIARGPLARLLFSVPGPLDRRRLEHVESIARLDDGLLRDLPPPILADPSLCAAVVSAVALLHARGLDPAPWLRRLPAGAGVRAVYRCLLVLFEEVEIPPTSLSLPSGWRQVRSLRELRALGRAHHMCVALAVDGADYWGRLWSGSLFVVREEPFSLIEFERVAEAVWYLREAVGTKNGLLRHAELTQVRDEFARAGFPTSPVNPWAGLRTLELRADSALRRAEREFCMWADEFGEAA